MPSPFPGMNPYLEQDDAWHDFHERFSPVCAELLTLQVRPNYIVKIDEQLYIHELAGQARRFLGRSDVGLARSESTSALGSDVTLLEAPVQGNLPAAVDIERLSFVEIRDRHNRELITVIELLSPTNKRVGPDRDQYLAKRKRLINSRVHLVEIDLLRGGPRMPTEGLPDCDYCVLVSRMEARPRVGIWPIRLRDRLPGIPIPLRAPDRDARLDLQDVLHRIYDAAGYEDYIYGGAPEPPLSADDAAWTRQFVPPLPD